MTLARSLVFLSLLLCAAPQALADDQADAASPEPVHVQGVQILEYGTYTSDIEYFMRDDGVVDHNKIIASNFVLVEATDQVQADLDTGFGVRYVVLGQPEGAPVQLDVVVDHPPLTNPQTGEAYTQSKADFTRIIGRPEYTVWTFDQGWSLAPGVWTIRLEYQGRELARKEFTVTLAP